MKIGDLVECFSKCRDRRLIRGVVVGFNEKGEGGKDFVHVLCDQGVHVYMSFDVIVIKEGSKA